MLSTLRKFLTGIRLVPSSSSTVANQGEMEVLSASGKINYHNGTTASPVVTEAHSATITNKVIDGDDNTVQDLPITAIKTNLTDASKFMVRDASGVPTSATKDVPTGTVVGTTDSQTITNKTINGDNNTLSNVGISSLKTVLADAGKFIARDGSGAPVSTNTVPSGTVVGTSDSQTLTNKTLDASSNTISNLTNSNLSGSAAVSNANLATMANITIKGNNSGSTTTPSDLSATIVTSMLDNFVGDSGSGGTKGLVPAPASGDSTKFLKGDGTWATVSGGSGISWTEVTGTTQTMAVNNGYIANNASQVALTLPATSSVGDTVYIVGKGSGGWNIKSNSSAAAQTVKFSNETSPTSSSSAISLRISVYAADAITLVCTVANSVWTALDHGSSQPYIVATGGTITTDGNYKVHTFTSSETFTITSGSGSVDALVVAGGGGGAGGLSTECDGGGGAGGYRYLTGLSYTPGAYTVTIGAGGAGGANASGSNGSNSVFDIYTSIGGGGGGHSTVGSSGGSGGGGGSGNSGGSGTVGQGNAGGTGFSSNAGGGGGGAGAVGGNAASVAIAGNGGVGLSNSITGSSVFYAGGGGGSANGGGTGGSGGNGGGGAGSVGTGSGVAGTANTGGGGGAGGNNSPGGGAGGSGVVIIRYQFQ